MKKSMLIAAVLTSLAFPAMAQQAAPEAKVALTAVADMPSLKDISKRDSFTVRLADGQIVTSMNLGCQLGKAGTFGFGAQDRGCEVTGTGSILNPKNPQQMLPRAQYAGGYVVQKDGTTAGDKIVINYLALGRVAASSASFGGSMNLKPELTSGGAQALKDSVLKSLKGSNGNTLIDERVDTIDFNRFYVPSAGLPSDKGTTWTGNMVFSYQTESWYLRLVANYNGTEYKLEGNMPWTDSVDDKGQAVDGQTQYDLTLTLPGANAQGDDALFASSGDDDLFAAADGISGQIIMKQGKMVTVKIDGEDTETPSYVEASGTLTGTNVPLEVVRSWATVMGILSQSLYGA